MSYGHVEIDSRVFIMLFFVLGLVAAAVIWWVIGILEALK